MNWGVGMGRGRVEPCIITFMATYTNFVANFGKFTCCTLIVGVRTRYNFCKATPYTVVFRNKKENVMILWSSVVLNHKELRYSAGAFFSEGTGRAKPLLKYIGKGEKMEILAPGVRSTGHSNGPTTFVMRSSSCFFRSAAVFAGKSRSPLQSRCNPPGGTSLFSTKI